MVIKTKLSELDETIYKYSDLLGWADGIETQDGDNVETHLGISNYRIQVPSLNISLRSGCLMSQHGGEYSVSYNSQTGERKEVDIPPPADEPWEVDASVTVVCELDEKDPTKYFGWDTSDFIGTVYRYFYPKLSYEVIGEYECFIDTTDFMENEEKAQHYAKCCEEQYEDESADD